MILEQGDLVVLQFSQFGFQHFSDERQALQINHIIVTTVYSYFLYVYICKLIVSTFFLVTFYLQFQYNVFIPVV